MNLMKTPILGKPMSFSFIEFIENKNKIIKIYIVIFGFYYFFSKYYFSVMISSIFYII